MTDEIKVEAAIKLQMQCNDGSWVDVNEDYGFNRNEIESVKARFQADAKANSEQVYRIDVKLGVVTHHIITL